MNVILQEPSSVLVTSSADDTAGRVRDALESCEDVSVVVAPTAERALERLGEDQAIGCVVVDETLADAAAFREAVVELDAALPVVFLARAADRELLSRLSRYHATTYLPQSVTDETLRETVTDALDDYHDRRVTAEESDMLRAMMSEMEVPIFVKDESGRHLRMTEVPGGVDQDAVIGKTDLEVYSYDQEAAEQFYRDDMRVIEEGQPVDGKIEGSGPPGNEHYALAHKVPWPGPDGTTKGLIGVSLDVTDVVEKANRADHLEDRLEQFAGYVSHDLKNPLSVASGHLELAKENGEAGSLTAVGDALERIEEMIDDLEHLARRPPDGGLADFVEVSFVARQVWSFIETGDADLVVDLPETAQVHVSVEQLRPLLENLFRNAVVHGGDDVTVRVGALEDGFYVADDGPGIPPDERETVLQRGYTTAEGGSGTGLAIVSEIVEDNDWSLTISESDDGGAAFEIREALVVAEPTVDYGVGTAVDLAATRSIPSSAAAGSVERDDERDTLTLTSGSDARRQGRSDFYAYAEAEGPVRIQARLRSVDHVNDFSNAGLMIRGGLEEDDAYGFAGRTVGRGTELRYRPSPGGEPSGTLLGESHDYEWFRLDRVGETVTCSVSRDGEEWEALDQRRVRLADPVTVGVAVSSAVPGQPSRATFSSVEASKLE